MNTGILVAMILGGLAAIVGILQAKKGAAGGKPVALLGAALALGLSVQRLVQPSQQELRIAQNERFAFVSGEQLGIHLAKQHSAARATIFTRPDLDSLSFTSVEGSSVEGLQAALAAGFESVDRVPMPSVYASSQESEDAQDYMMMESQDWVDWDKLKEMLTGSAKTDVAVFTVSPPADFFQSDSETPGAMPKVGILNSMPDEVLDLVESGAVSAAVLISPKIESLPELGEDLLDSRATFDRLYVLVTSENLADVRGKFSTSVEP